MTRLVVRAIATVAAAGALASLALAAAPSGARPTCALAAADFHVAVLIQGAKTAHSLCVSYTAATSSFDAATRSITGEEVLHLSQVKYQAVDYGGSLGRAVCQVDDEPPTPAGGFTTRNCLGNPYWILWKASPNGGWVSAGSGISRQRFADGDAEGMSYGGAALPDPHGLCPAAQPWPTATASAPAGGSAAGVGSGPAGAGTSTVGAAPPSGSPTGTPETAATPSPGAGAQTHGRGGPGGAGGRLLSSSSQQSVSAPMPAASAEFHAIWSASGGGLVAAAAAVLALTSLLLAQVLRMGRKR